MADSSCQSLYIPLIRIDVLCRPAEPNTAKSGDASILHCNKVVGSPDLRHWMVPMASFLACKPKRRGSPAAAAERDAIRLPPRACHRACSSFPENSLLD